MKVEVEDEITLIILWLWWVLPRLETSAQVGRHCLPRLLRNSSAKEETVPSLRYACLQAAIIVL